MCVCVCVCVCARVNGERAWYLVPWPSLVDKLDAVPLNVGVMRDENISSDPTV